MFTLLINNLVDTLNNQFKQQFNHNKYNNTNKEIMAQPNNNKTDDDLVLRYIYRTFILFLN